MDLLKKIIIRGESGYGPVTEAYTDKVTIQADSIKYEYVPYQVSEINPVRRWSYRTTSVLFQKLYEETCVAVKKIIERDIDDYCTDIGSIQFLLTTESGEKLNKTFYLPGEEFKDCFSIIKHMVPDCEYVPAVLLTDEDYPE